MQRRSTHRRTGLLAAALAVTLALGVSACDRDAPAADAARTDAPAADSTVYVDMCTPEEFAAGHVRGAIHIPHTEMDQRWRELEEYRDERLVLYCRSGRRSGIALDILERHGFDNAVNGGGLRDLSRQGVPTTDG